MKKCVFVMHCQSLLVTGRVTREVVSCSNALLKHQTVNVANCTGIVVDMKFCCQCGITIVMVTPNRKGSHIQGVLEV